MATLYHGTHKQAHAAHEGICLTSERESAEAYATSRGIVYECEIDLDILTVEECGGYDHDTDDCEADDAGFRRAAAARGVDVLTYDDEDQFANRITCYRLVSERAIAACVLTLAAVDAE